MALKVTADAPEVDSAFLRQQDEKRAPEGVGGRCGEDNKTGGTTMVVRLLTTSR